MKKYHIPVLVSCLFAPLAAQAQDPAPSTDPPASMTSDAPNSTGSPTTSSTTSEAPQSAATNSAAPESANTKPRIFYGGGIGLSFGDVQYFEIWPVVGVNLTQKLGVGVQLLYRHRKDTRYEEDLTTDDYGATVFGRYLLPGPLFLQAEYEYLDYEYYEATLSGVSTKRDNFSSFMAGGGVSQAIGGTASLFATVLYNFSYDQEDSPYDNPWIVRFGVGVGL